FLDEADLLSTSRRPMAPMRSASLTVGALGSVVWGADRSTVNGSIVPMAPAWRLESGIAPQSVRRPIRIGILSPAQEKVGLGQGELFIQSPIGQTIFQQIQCFVVRLGRAGDVPQFQPDVSQLVPKLRLLDQQFT